MIINLKFIRKHSHKTVGRMARVIVHHVNNQQKIARFIHEFLRFHSKQVRAQVTRLISNSLQFNFECALDFYFYVYYIRVQTKKNFLITFVSITTSVKIVGAFIEYCEGFQGQGNQLAYIYVQKYIQINLEMTTISFFIYLFFIFLHLQDDTLRTMFMNNLNAPTQYFIKVQLDVVIN